MSERKYPVSRKKEYEFRIEKLAFGGAGVTRVDNYVIFVKGAVPGDVVRARITKRKSAYAEARLLDVLQPSELRQEPPCHYFPWCGGCTWQQLSYNDQLRFKQEIVREAFSHLAGFEDPPVRPIIAAEEPLGYRNKMEFSFSDRRWLLPDELGTQHEDRDFALGLHVPGTFDKIIHLEECLLQPALANRVLNRVASYARENGLQPYGIRSHEGFLRFLIIRTSRYNGTMMVNIVTGYEAPEKLKPLAKRLQEEFPQVVSVVNNVNTRLAQVAFGEKEILLAGQPFIEDKIGPFLFKISANSFFQTNTQQAEKLYRVALDFAGLTGREIVWDLYAGAGTISLFLAKQAKEVIGFELVESAVADAEKNATEHGVNNVRFLGGDLLHQLHEAQPKPQVLVTDPPRSGMHPKVVNYLKELGAQRIVYVSCNPTTLARDVALLKDIYSVQAIQPVDMFPQTYHIETVALLEKRGLE